MAMQLSLLADAGHVIAGIEDGAQRAALLWSAAGGLGFGRGTQDATTWSERYQISFAGPAAARVLSGLGAPDRRAAGFARESAQVVGPLLRSCLRPKF
jgi:hypothetical protein